MFKGGVTFRSDELYLALKQSILVLSSPSFGFVLGLGAFEGVPSLKAVRPNLSILGMTTTFDHSECIRHALFEANVNALVVSLFQKDIYVHALHIHTRCVHVHAPCV